MPNMGSIIKNHNDKILKNNVIQEPEQKKCNCRVPDQCPLNGKCLTTCVVYKADVITDDDQRQYTGLTEGTFKQRYYNHQLSLRDRKYSNSIELSKYAWKLKESNKFTTSAGPSIGELLRTPPSPKDVTCAWPRSWQ